jgi:CO dehydrogenase nickel-insertion accessory protein CooC1
VDEMLVVVEPGWASMQTAARVAALARDLRIRQIHAVANKISGDADLAFVRAHLEDPPLLGTLPFDRDLELEARTGSVSRDRPFYREMLRIAQLLGRR